MNFIAGHLISLLKLQTSTVQDDFQINPTYKYNFRGPFNSFEKEGIAFLNHFFRPLEFKKVRLDKLRNPLTKRKLEIDAYNDLLKIGVEFDGFMHHVKSSHFHKTEEDWEKSKQRDRIKDALCKKAGIKLVRVPYNLHRSSLKSFLIIEVGKLL